MATDCAVSPAFTFHNRKTSPWRRTGWPCIKYHRCRCTHARQVCTRECVYQPRARGRSGARRFYYRESTGSTMRGPARARARACVSESGARRRTTHTVVLTSVRREYAPMILTSRRRRFVYRPSLFRGFANVLPRAFTFVSGSENRSGFIPASVYMFCAFVTSSFNPLWTINPYTRLV